MLLLTGRNKTKKLSLLIHCYAGDRKELTDVATAKLTRVVGERSGYRSSSSSSSSSDESDEDDDEAMVSR